MKMPYDVFLRELQIAERTTGEVEFQGIRVVIHTDGYIYIISPGSNTDSSLTRCKTYKEAYALFLPLFVEVAQEV